MRTKRYDAFSVAEKNSLQAKFPEIAKELHPTKNNGLTADHVSYGSSSKKLWWKCPRCGYEYEATANKRTGSGRGCPACGGQIVSQKNSLLFNFPKIAKELHAIKNQGITADQIARGSNKKFWWKCPEGHEYQMRVQSRTGQAAGCPFCKTLQAKFPEIAKELHSTKNSGITADQISSGSEQIFWWICPNGHEYQTSAESRSRGTGCQICKTLLFNSPELAKELHPTKNNGLTADQISFGSGQKFWWTCANEHVYTASAHDRSKGSGCPYCAGKKASSTNSLAARFPEIASEWHPTRNDSLTANEFTGGSHRKVWWTCSKLHEWEATINSRTSKKAGCPFCYNSNRWTVAKIREFVASLLPHLSTFTPAELYSLFQQSGIIDIQVRKSFARAVASGKFSKEELEKFSKGEPSLADDFLNDSITISDYVDDEENLDVVVDEYSDLSCVLPVIETTDILNSLNMPIISSADEEAVKFFIASGISKLWKHAYRETTSAIKQAEDFQGNGYASQVRNEFLKQYHAAVNLKIPKGYTFAIDGEPTQPNLMQRHFASLVACSKKVGNWSGGGAGKTLSAILATRVVNSSFIVICCPNSTVEGWQKAIQQSFGNIQVEIRTFTPRWKNKSPRYLILHYEAFQQPDSAKKVKKLLKSEKIDFIIIDEIHFAKQREIKNVSQRRELITGLVLEAGERNPDLHVVGMSATPVVNNLFEGKSIVEAITGLEHDDLNTRSTIPNCMKLYQKLVQIGIRWYPQYDLEYEEQRIPVDCSEFIDEIRALGKNGSPLALEYILTKARLPIIRKSIKPKTVIYTHYKERIEKVLREALTSDGWKVGFFTGEDKSGLNEFLYGDLDVLIATSTISTGVDELQHVCNHFVINALPWTATEFDQLKHRFYRQGQNQKVITAIIPMTYAQVNGQRWSWCESKMERLKFKRSIADAAVDGIVPEGHLRSPQQAYRDVMDWLERLESGELRTIERTRIVVPLPDTAAGDVSRRLAKYGDFAAMNRRWNASHSTTTNERLQKNPEEWEQYHTLYREHRKDWAVVPYEEMIGWCRKRKGYVIGDFGCGEAKLAEGISDSHTVHSFDHIAINHRVTACDMAHTPLEDGCLDVAIFSLSLLMGTNRNDYLTEAWRTLRLDGWLHIIEKTKSIPDVDGFVKSVESLGFKRVSSEDIWKFRHIQLIKTERKFGNKS